MTQIQFILASQSPRRRELLQNAGFQFTVLPGKVSEISDKNLNPEQQILQIAETKAQATLQQNPGLLGSNSLILSADTEVVLEGELLGKPQDPSQAESFLHRLSGRAHEVITGLVLLDCRDLRQEKAAETTKILFRKLTQNEIHAYVSGPEPYDKAGGYGIQGDAGKFVERIDGPYDNVVGLPLELLKHLIQKGGWHV